MNQRMSWEDIVRSYPKQWVGLTDVLWEADNDATVESGVVTYTDVPKGELTRLMIHSDGKIVACYTEPDAGTQIGAVIENV